MVGAPCLVVQVRAVPNPGTKKAATNPKQLEVILIATVYTNAGKAWVAGKMSGAEATSPDRIGWGTGAGTAAVTDTTLFTEAAETRATATLSRVTTSVTDDTFQAVGTLTSLSSQTITNAGLFDAASAGDLIIHGDHAGLPLLADDSIQYTIKLQQS